MSQTIYALATAPGRSAVSVIRISGPQARDVAAQLRLGRLAARQAAVRVLRHPQTAEPIDEALVLWFRGPASYTGEDCLELHVHGSPTVVEALFSCLQGLGLRLAEPGEFTRRAFENGKLDLAQAEGVGDLIDAETEAQRRQALSQVRGALGTLQRSWRERLVEALSVLEAAVDFPDEEIPADVAARARPVLTELVGELELALLDVQRGERIRQGYRIALTGAPNAGKSTALNALVGREAAIVTDRPGTTRDVIEAPLTLGAYRVLLADTAGLRDTDDVIEEEGVRRAFAWAQAADLRLWFVDRSAREIAGEQVVSDGDILVLTKADLDAGPARATAISLAHTKGLDVLEVDLRTADGAGALRGVLENKVTDALSASLPAAATRVRHAGALTTALGHLRSALSQELFAELAAEDVRLAIRSLDRITGRVHPEDVLDRVFATFCIGK